MAHALDESDLGIFVSKTDEASVVRGAQDTLADRNMNTVLTYMLESDYFVDFEVVNTDECQGVRINYKTSLDPEGLAAMVNTMGEACMLFTEAIDAWSALRLEEQDSELRQWESILVMHLRSLGWALATSSSVSASSVHPKAEGDAFGGEMLRWGEAGPLEARVPAL